VRLHFFRVTDAGGRDCATTCAQRAVLAAKRDADGIADAAGQWSGAGGARCANRKLAEPQFTSFAAEAVRLCQSYGARVLLNGDPDLARELGANGVHLPASQLMASEVRPDFKLVAASCHNAAELERAEQLQLDFALLGPVATTASHPGQAGMGWSQFATLAQHRSLPIFAIGGMTQGDFTEAWRHGAHGIAGIRSAWIA
jgi:8-oxo-dGTP diphosphatase